MQLCALWVTWKMVLAGTILAAGAILAGKLALAPKGRGRKRVMLKTDP